ncbi:hypothetical protein L1049_005836 [Liquidambar formosana]|uniref:SHSP domain-containing protein n=1 Tax=Liquidambar formosana TaxID=63359 RepID=A0AAP0RG16_LIQFO
MVSPYPRIIATGSTLFKFLLCSNPRRPMFSSVTTRFLHTSDTHLPRSDNDNGEEPKCRYSPFNPFQSSGPVRPASTLPSEEGLRVRLDMPGVRKDGLKVWVKNESVFFEGKELKEDDAEEARHYGGSLELWGFDLNEVKASLKNGVLKFKIPPKKNLQEEKELEFKPVRVE